MDKSCLMNDPNGPLFDPVHMLYHIFFQDHLALPGGVGPVWAHAVSKDLAHWARLPVALWNDELYDSLAIYTGSATVTADGDIFLVYPGICNKTLWSNCSTGTNLAVALPANRSDPLLREWRKLSSNPVVNNTQRE